MKRSLPLFVLTIVGSLLAWWLFARTPATTSAYVASVVSAIAGIAAVYLAVRGSGSGIRSKVRVGTAQNTHVLGVAAKDATQPIDSEVGVGVAEGGSIKGVEVK